MFRPKSLNGFCNCMKWWFMGSSPGNSEEISANMLFVDVPKKVHRCFSWAACPQRVPSTPSMKLCERFITPPGIINDDHRVHISQHFDTWTTDAHKLLIIAIIHHPWLNGKQHPILVDLIGELTKKCFTSRPHGILYQLVSGADAPYALYTAKKFGGIGVCAGWYAH